jgi:hypothetical protein
MVTFTIPKELRSAVLRNPEVAYRTMFDCASEALNPDYSRCVGVDTAKACFIGVLFQVCGFDKSPTT